MVPVRTFRAKAGLALNALAAASLNPNLATPGARSFSSMDKALTIMRLIKGRRPTLQAFRSRVSLLGRCPCLHHTLHNTKHGDETT